MKDRPPITLEQLRAISAGHRRNLDVRTLLWEIRRLYELIRRADDDRVVIERAWKEAGLGQLAALYHLRLLLRDEVRNLPKSKQAESGDVRKD